MESINALFQHATEAIIITDKGGNIIKANPSSQRIFGYSEGELLGLKVEALIPSRFAHKHEQHREGYNKHPHARSMGKDMVLHAKRKNDTEFPVEISLSYYKKDEDTFVIAFIIDITERVQHEEKVKKLNVDLEKKVKERTNVLQEALIELENSKDQLSAALNKEKELNDMKSRFVTMASHEFRTPLSTILSSISLIAKYTSNDHDEKRQKHVQRVKSAVTNMTLILNDFLSAEKLNEGKIYINNVEFSIKEMATEIIGEMNNLLKPGQKVTYTHTGSETIVLDKQIIRNTLLNLISNAIKFSGEDKQISVVTTNHNAELEIKVSDQGIGIPKEEQENLFERFFRAKNATNIQGTGLGLSIVVKYLELVNGKISFESELEKGTTFIIKVPNNQ